MPGICGFIASRPAMKKADAVLQVMQQSLVHRERHHCTPLFNDALVAAASVYLDATGQSQKPFIDSGCAVWIDGEFYPATPDPCYDTPAALLAEHFHAGTLLPFLKRVDGIFTAVIVDRKKQVVHCITDRYGIKPLYLYKQHNSFAWSSELKSFRALTWFSSQISQSAFSTFIAHGHFLNDATWFDDVRLLAPGTIYSVKVADCSGTSTQYIDFSDVELMKNRPSNSSSLVEKLGAAFKAAVEKRCRPGERVGVGLSGGLDSRALFAAIPRAFEPVPALTFGKEGCADIAIAHKVTTLRPSQHIVQSIDSKNWLTNRSDGIWVTDGQISMLHLHGIEQIDAIGTFYNVELNGFLGDALLGGSYARAPGGEIVQYLNRGRRLIATALTIGNLAYSTRLPFFDNDLMALTLSIPLKMRRNSFIYNQMLLSAFPEYFQNIPWQKTGLPISRTGAVWDALRFSGKCTSKAASMLHLPLGKNYFDYASWIKKEPAWSHFNALIGSDNSMIYEYISQESVRAVLKQHNSGKDRSDLLCKYVTAEVWMRQFFRSEWPGF